MAEILLSATLPVLFEKLASSDLYNFAFDEGVRSKLKKWERKLEKIEAVLTSAEEKQLTNRAVKLWLEDLQQLAYDVEDILEEFAYEASRHSSAPSCFKNFTPHAIKFDVSMRSRIEDISSRFEELCKERAELGLMHETSGGTPITSSQQRIASSSVPTEPAVCGRDADKRKILEMVLSDEASNDNLFVIGILGMGGIGKTTLAREVYNDKALDNKFMTKTWVSVSDDFDVLRVSKTILSSINELDEMPGQSKKSDKAKVQSGNEGVDDQSKKKEVEGGLDKVLEALKSPLCDAAFGSKIIVTTRNKEVVTSSTRSFQIYKLQQLPDDDCLKLFKSIAFGDRDPNAYGNICDKVVEKCKGLPLAVKTLAGVLRSKQIDLWENILTSRMWDSPDAGGILPVLRLSYFHLPPHLKRCFAYCAIFPKDYEFDKKELGLLWMAEGIIQQSNEQLDVAV
ncbi:putative disease resistance RPP13-like protein 1 [Pistacia vera]|uniref:putative disease resistance RPP13-like protein 1 n=1 Tax=Pistacia vera TaxID=55513 RepID=UPI001263C3DA|nr:putative disease resistance RPP13-like protein 1 [Pistacia vera]